MSRGHGRLQRRILELLEQYPDGMPQATEALTREWGVQEWTAGQFFQEIYFRRDRGVWADDDHAECRHASAETTIRRALAALELQGLVCRRLSRSPYRHRGRVRWAWRSTAAGSTARRARPA